MSATVSQSNDTDRGLKRSWSTMQGTTPLAKEKSIWAMSVPSRSSQDKPIDTSPEAVHALWSCLEEARSDVDAISKLGHLVNAEIDRLREEQACAEAEKRRLERVQGRIEKQIRNWELARPFHYFLQLPVELRGLIWDEYFMHEFRQSEYRRDCVRRGFAKPVTLVSKRVREEVVDWLCANRPYMIIFWAVGGQRGVDSPSGLEVKFMDGSGDGPRSWRNVPEELLARVQHVETGLNARYVDSDSFPRWSLDLLSEEVKMESMRNHDHKHAWNVLAVEYRSLVKNRLKVVLKAIVGQGVMRRRHFQLLFMPLLPKEMAGLRWKSSSSRKGFGAGELAIRSVEYV